MINPILPIPVIVIIGILMCFFIRKKTWNNIRHYITVALIVALLIRPSIQSDKVIVVTSNVDILFVVDDSISMQAEDYGTKNDPRMVGVRDHCNQIMEAFEGARYSVVTFNSESTTLVPYTYEKDLVMQALNALEGEAATYAQGTDLNLSYNAMHSAFRRSDKQGEDEDNTEATDNRMQIVFYISDGEIVGNKSLKSFTKLADYIDAGAVLGYGTTSGGKMLVRTYPLDDEKEYLQYYNENFDKVDGVSKIDEDNLEDIASDLGINYFHMTSSKNVKSVIDDVKDQIEDEEYSRNAKLGEGYMELYPFIAGALFIFVAYDTIYYRRKLSKEG